MRKALLVALAAVCLGTGAIAGRWWAWQTYSQLVVSKQIEAAQIAAIQAESLAELRLGETQQAIGKMESFMDDQVSMLAYRRDTEPLDKKSRERINRCLSPVKVYRESYPVGGDDAVRINALLATVPGRGPKSTCQNGVRRLDDLRLSKLHSTTNTP
ncbi:MAG: hypothetical protein ACTHLW_10615 [Verrucomicrobiota bacterium]